MKVIALADELSAADSHLRRTRATLVLASTTEELQHQPTDAELLKSGIWSEKYLITLGRIVEKSAGNEAMVRRLLGLGLRLPDGGLATQRYAEAIFLGARVRGLAASSVRSCRSTGTRRGCQRRRAGPTPLPRPTRNGTSYYTAHPHSS